jgi:hypothetical protein
MMYTRAMFGLELKKQVMQKLDIVAIGIWAHTIYLENCDAIEPGLRKIMLDLNTMELGPEFAISYEMLSKIADDLIAGKSVDLNSEEYRETGP